LGYNTYKTLKTKKKNRKKVGTKKEPYLKSGYAFGKAFSMEGQFLCKKPS
jgi:hypothetical protein